MLSFDDGTGSSDWHDECPTDVAKGPGEMRLTPHLLSLGQEGGRCHLEKAGEGESISRHIVLD